MNNKGFTLIELLAVIVLIAIIGVITIPNVTKIATGGKQASYDLLVKNIKVAAENYYTECEYGDLSNVEKYGGYACQIASNKVNITLGTLANTGFLSTTETNSNGKKIVLDPRKSSKDLSDCPLTIKKVKDANGKITYSLSSDNSSCPYGD